MIPSPMIPLDYYAVLHRTDKGSPHHNYTPYYEQYFAPIQKSAITLLEIGVAEGASLKMWRDWLPNAHVCGMDCSKPINIPGCDIFEGRQENEVDLDEIVETIKPIHIIIDDAGHQELEQIVCFKYLWPRLEPRGWYVIEDIATSYGQNQKLYQFLQSLIDTMNLRDRVDMPEAVVAAQCSRYYHDVDAIHYHRDIVFIRKST